MKKIAGFVTALFLLVACGTSEKKTGIGSGEDIIKDSLQQVEKQKVIEDTANYTTIQWLDSTFISKGKVKEGAEVEIVFRFKNTGDKPLVFSKVEARCGCTVADKPEEPIAPGQEGSITGKFDSKGRPGNNRKFIAVEANTKPSRNHNLEFEVNVE